jgi:hypothetical protein|tara:strand:+ start:88 stop:303 length:216 start_codon:yes stop_codon:yes gene_type:complete
MKIKEQVIFDIKSDEFKYLHREENKLKKKVDIDVLNKRLNDLKKSNIYSNAKMIAFSLATLAVFILISVKF